jgi:hypothetical protein
MMNSKDEAMSTSSSSKDLFNTNLSLLLGAIAVLMLFVPEIR